MHCGAEPTRAGLWFPAYGRTHGPSSCRLRSFGSSTSANVEPGCPGCPPGLRPLLRRSDFGAGLVNGESDDRGFEELRLSCPSCRFSSATSPRSTSTTNLRSDTIARSSVFSTASSS